MTGNFAGMLAHTVRAMLTDVTEPTSDELADAESRVIAALSDRGHSRRVSVPAAARLRDALRNFGAAAETLRAAATQLIEARKAVQELLNTERKQ